MVSLTASCHYRQSTISVAECLLQSWWQVPLRRVSGGPRSSQRNHGIRPIRIKRSGPDLLQHALMPGDTGRCHNDRNPPKIIETLLENWRMIRVTGIAVSVLVLEDSMTNPTLKIAPAIAMLWIACAVTGCGGTKVLKEPVQN
jgi:hypothetical protein